jgi:hypothetical protein
MPTNPPGRTLSEATIKDIADRVAETLKPLLKVVPLHEMSMDELRDEMTRSAAKFQAKRNSK